MSEPQGRHRDTWTHSRHGEETPYAARRRLARAAKWRWAKTHKRHAINLVWPLTLNIALTVMLVVVDIFMPPEGISRYIALAGMTFNILCVAATGCFTGMTLGLASGRRAGTASGRRDQRFRTAVTKLGINPTTIRIGTLRPGESVRIPLEDLLHKRK